MNHLKALLIRHEGMKLKVYQDSLGIPTIGVGRNLLDRGISQPEAMYMLHNDIQSATNDLISAIGDPLYTSLNDPRRHVLISMVFNMGKTRFIGFKNVIQAVRARDWEKAATEMLDSKWAGQVGQRARDLAWMMRTGEWQSPELSSKLT